MRKKSEAPRLNSSSYNLQLAFALCLANWYRIQAVPTSSPFTNSHSLQAFVSTGKNISVHLLVNGFWCC